jgi:coenzyme F420 biosynthesis associated uncharacterized protein
VTTPIDAALAARTGAGAARPGPDIPRDQAASAVAALRAASRRAVAYVAEVTGLTEAASEAATVGVHVIGRAGFVQANARMAAAIADGAFGATATRFDRVATSVELGLVLAFLSSRVLGQFDPFCGHFDAASPAPSGPIACSGGLILLVAPNVVAYERELDVPPADFRLWVALHEMTHAVQFAAAPWLAGHLLGLLRSLAADEFSADDGATPARLVKAVVRAARGDSGTSIVSDLLDGPAREAMDAVTATMSLLEGHADVVMDAVGTEVIPSLALIRERFNARRRGRSGFDRLVRRVAGLDVKTSQYVQGAAFVRGVQMRAGNQGLAAAFATAENLPSPAEIADPAAWVTRVIG